MRAAMGPQRAPSGPDRAQTRLPHGLFLRGPSAARICALHVSLPPRSTTARGVPTAATDVSPTLWPPGAERRARRRSRPATNAHLGSRWQPRASVRAPAPRLPGYAPPRAPRAARIEIRKRRGGAGAGGAAAQRTHPGASQGDAGPPRVMEASSAPPAACHARHTALRRRSPRFSLPDFRRRARARDSGPHENNNTNIAA